MKKGLLMSVLLMCQTVVFSQIDTYENIKFKVSKQSSKSSSTNKSAVAGACGLDTVRYAENKAYYLQAGFNDPTTGGWNVNKLTSATNIVTTAYKVPSGGSVTVSAAEVLGLIMLTNYGAISTPTISNHKVYLYNVDVDNMPIGLPIDSADMVFTNDFESQRATFLNGPHTMTSDFAIGVKGGATSDATHFLYVAFNEMHVSTDVTNPYGEHLSFKYQPSVPGFIDMATNFGDPTYDFEFAVYPIVTYDFSVDFSPSLLTACGATPITLTNTSVGTSVFTSHSFSLSAFASRYNVTEGSNAGELPRDSIYQWYTGINTSVLTNSYNSISFTTQATAGTYNDTLFVLALTHDYNYCYQKQIIPYTILASPATPTFSVASSVCSGATAPVLPAVSDNTISGTWSPSTVSNTASDTYTFTPSADYCASAVPLTITVDSPVTPLFSSISSSICSGATSPVLVTTSDNSINGTWSPSTVSNTSDGTYTFTPANGLCATTTTASVTITPSVTPTFSSVAPICSGDAAPVLPTTSNNSITGSWSPAVSNTGTGTYTFTPNMGGCETTATTTVVVNTPTDPTFSHVTTICSGATAPSLATTSTNSIAGTWSPSTVDNMNTATYVFTPNSGQCAATLSSTITVSTSTITPTFSIASSICSGATAPVLATTSNNSITGTWSPSVVSNTATDTYVFTPNSGSCASTESVTVTVNQNTTTPAFTLPTSICNGAVVPQLPTTSDNAVTGTWSPSTVSNASSGTYTFTPTAGGACATTTTASITVNSMVTPTFTLISSLCYGDNVPVLPTTSDNAITGVWTPSVIDNTNTTAYSFEPTNGVCANLASATIVVNPIFTPTFTLPDVICIGGTAPTLVTTSNNSITGTWSPSTVNNTTAGSYVFTPTSSAGCTIAATVNIGVEDCSGIDEVSTSNFSVYPNPASDVISISFSNLAMNQGTIRFYTTDGKLIEEREFTNSSVESFDVKSLTKGVYFFQIGDITEKVIIQ